MKIPPSVQPQDQGHYDKSIITKELCCFCVDAIIYMSILWVLNKERNLTVNTEYWI